jgi:hypothetical protein
MVIAETSFGWPTTAGRVEESGRMIYRWNCAGGCERYVERERYYRVEASCHLIIKIASCFYTAIILPYVYTQDNIVIELLGATLA